MLTFDDKGGRGVKKTPKPAYVIHGCSLIEFLFLTFEVNFICEKSSESFWVVF